MGPRARFWLCTWVMAALLILLGSAVWNLAIFPHHGALGYDFAAFYAAGWAIRHGYDPYNWTQLQAVEAHLHAVGNPHRFMVFNSFANPPLFAWMMAPFITLSAHRAYAMWALASGVSILIAIVVWSRAYGVRGRGWAVTLCAVTPASATALFLGQQTPFLLLALVLALVALRQGRLTLAGVLFSVGWIKPHLLFPLICLIVLATHRREAFRFMAGFLGATIVLGALSWLTAGALLAAWARTLVVYGQTIDARQPILSSLAGFYLTVLRRPWSSVAAALILGVCLLLAIPLVVTMRHYAPRDDEWARLAALSFCAWLLATPYTHPPDLVLLYVALPIMLGRRLEGLRDPRVILAVSATLIAPEIDLLGFRPAYFFSYSVFVPLTVALALLPIPVSRRRRLTVHGPTHIFSTLSRKTT